MGMLKLSNIVTSTVASRFSHPPVQQSLDSDLSDGPISMQEFQEVKNALCVSEAKIQQLMKVNTNLSDELRLMQKKVPAETHQ